jgi:hypothetical protein
MSSIGLTNDDGEQIEREVVSRKGSFKANVGDSATSISPSVVTRIKFDNKGQMSSITTECGETENRRSGNNKPNITVEGIITSDEIETMRSMKNEEEVKFISDIYKGNVIVERLSIIQTQDLHYYKEDGGPKQLAFEFQMQLKKPE